MKRSVLLIVTSLLSILLMTLHLADDYVRGLSTPGPDNVIGVAILLVWLYGTLMLAEHRAGYVIVLLGSLFASAMPVLHMNGKSYPEIALSGGGFFFIWTVLTIGVTGAFSLILAARCVWDPEWAKSRLTE
jgi:hypothetical protein